MSRATRRESVRLLETAFEAGIRHYDVARSYGHGEAESALGDFLAGRRDQVTVATKLGMEPPPRSRRLAVAKGLARAAVRVVPPLRRVARERAARLVAVGRFAVPEARASLETSLRELRTDHLDLLLLHEVRPPDLSDELLGFLEDQVREGTVRAFGIATVPEASGAIVAERPEFAPLVQVENSAAVPTLERMPELLERRVITHSSLQGLDEVRRRAPGHDPGELADLMLAWALAANPGGTVLFSSRDPEHIRRNARLEVTPELAERARGLAGELRAA
jgi:aryl-alcohol dehydrogenase-like predicted oxidoreductase